MPVFRLMPQLRVARRKLHFGALVAWASTSCQAHQPAQDGPTPLESVQLRPIVASARPNVPTVTLSYLTSPERASAPRAVVRRLFDAIEQESSPALSEILSENAVLLRPNKDPSSALLVWVRRFAAHDYTQSNPALLAAEPNIQVLDRDSYHQLRAIRDLHLEPGPDEVLAVVALDQAADKLWGTQLQLILNRDSGSWRARALWEDYSQF